MHDVTTAAMVLLTTKLATKNLVVVISHGNVSNMVVAWPKLSFHLLQFTSHQTVLLLKINSAPSGKVLFALVLLT